MTSSDNTRPRDRAELLDAFLATEYRVWPVADTVVVRIGAPAPGLDWRLRHRPWVIITPYNPGGIQADPEDNMDALTRMCIRLNRDFGLELHPARNVDPSGRWPDESAVLAVKPPEHVIRQAVDEFGQLGVVSGGPSQVVELWVFGEGWPEALPKWVRCMDRTAPGAES